MCAADEPDMALLASRIARVKSGEFDCKCITLRQTLLPGQRLRLTAPPEMVQLFTATDELPIVVVGVQERGQRPTRAVEVTLDAAPLYKPVVPGIHPEGTADLVIRARRRVVDVVQLAEASPSVSRPARARSVDLDAAPASAEVVARAEALSVVVQQWLKLVRRACRESTPTHLDDVLAELGPMPDAERPNARALWVAGVINPLPPLGAPSSKTSSKTVEIGPSVAPEIRPSTLMAQTVEARLSSVEVGLAESIRVLRKSVDTEYDA